MTFQEEIDRITDELQRSDLSSQVALAIKDAIRHFETEKFWFNEKMVTTDTTDGVEYYGLPNDYLDIDTITLTHNDYTYPLTPRSFRWIESVQSNDNYKGRPTDYCIYGEQIRLYPIPDGTYRLEMAMTYKLPELSATSDTNAWLDDGERLIRYYAKGLVLDEVIQGPEAEAQADRQFIKAQAELQRLRVEATSRKTTNTIKPMVI